MKTLIYFLSFLCSIVSNATQNTSLFEEANTLYNQERYNEALSKYKTVLESGEHSAELYFNMANAHYKLNHIAPSIYYYEEALRLAPNDKAIKNNLAFAQNMTIDAIDVIPKMGISRLFDKVIMSTTFNGWALRAVLFSITFAVLFILYYFAISTKRKRLAFVGSGISLLLVLIALIFAFKNQAIVNANKPAIVFAKESNVKNEPNFGSQNAFTLHEGTKVQVLENINNWKKIKLSDGKEGWIVANDIKMLRSL